MSRSPADAPPPHRPSPVLWICALVLVMVLAYVVTALLTADETLRTLVAVAVGVAVFVPLRERIWGGDLATARRRSREPRERRR